MLQQCLHTEYKLKITLAFVLTAVYSDVRANAKVIFMMVYTVHMAVDHHISTRP